MTEAITIEQKKVVVARGIGLLNEENLTIERGGKWTIMSEWKPQDGGQDLAEVLAKLDESEELMHKFEYVIGFQLKKDMPGVVYSSRFIEWVLKNPEKVFNAVYEVIKEGVK